MATYEDKWFEVWFTEGTDIVPSWLLIMTPDKDNPQHVVVIDPLEKFKVVNHGRTYEDACDWLLEDEFSQVKGREFPDDGWPLKTNDDI